MTEEVKVDESKVEDEAFLAEMAEPIMDADAPVIEHEPEAEEVKDAEPELEDEDPGDVETNDEPERVEVMAGYTEDEIRANFEQLAKLQKSIDTTNGTFGSRFAEMQTMIEGLKGQVGKSATLSPEIIDRVGEEFPEFADLLRPTDEEPLEDEPQIEAVAPQDDRINAFIEEQNQRDQSRELRSLTKLHADWQEIAMFSRDQNGLVLWNDQGFGQFVAGLPEDERHTLLNVWDADFVGDKITEYKATLEPAVQKQKTNRPSLEDAVRPKGLPGQPAPSEADEEDEAFRKEMAAL